ncbi:MAG: UDP-N-acetylmuramoyl-tripeptide--D-alanyl-D-alanine ligase [Gemmatimonadaceae bacterium]|nr:UDP-N-acetylmuramoyl-tripeptide--D-alanyl-D-alanine ligase [Gemmatimonadaceae bacterium]
MNAPFWTLQRLAQALGDGPSDGRPIAGVTTDTRAVQPGQCFVALRGETFDGHDFLAEAVAKGAAALVVSDPRPAATLGVPVFVVPDTLVALGMLGRYRRLAWQRPVVAVGGSNGKTSTKELLKAVLGSRLTVHATTGNLNNRIGVPLTLLALDDAADVAVVEAGTNEPGEIAILRDIIQPDVAVVTTVQEEHLEGLGDLAGVMAEELALCDDVPVAVVPASEPEVVAEAEARAGRTIAAALPASHGLHPDGRGWLELDGVRLESPLRGAHNLRNAALALAVGREFGLDAAAMAEGLAAMPLPPMRSHVGPLGRALLINDAYNANPGSARAALALLADVGQGRQRVAVLGTMRELGTHAPQKHREVAEAALAGGHDLVAGIGDFKAALTALAAQDPRVVVADDVEDLWPLLEARLAPDAAILLKASRGVKLERLVPHLTTWAAR